MIHPHPLLRPRHSPPLRLLDLFGGIRCDVQVASRPRTVEQKPDEQGGGYDHPDEFVFHTDGQVVELNISSISEGINNLREKFSLPSLGRSIQPLNLLDDADQIHIGGRPNLAD